MAYEIKKAAVLGAGVMGAQIAAHCANADVAVMLFDLERNLILVSGTFRIPNRHASRDSNRAQHQNLGAGIIITKALFIIE